MVFQEFDIGDEVFKFYFDNEGTLQYRHLPILRYHKSLSTPRDILGDHILVTLVERKENIHHQYPVVLIDKDYLIAKAKFLYNYFMYYENRIELFKPLSQDKKIYPIVVNYYNDFVKDYPDIILKMDNDTVVIDGNQFWK